jgi:hypothetical protein
LDAGAQNIKDGTKRFTVIHSWPAKPAPRPWQQQLNFSPEPIANKKAPIYGKL